VAHDADAAAAELRQYAKLVEQRFGLTMWKYNLHLLVCCIAQQECARGRAAHSTEYWFEPYSVGKVHCEVSYNLIP
jgi:hypothetical protein